jgi:thioredoxin 1
MAVQEITDSSFEDEVINAGNPVVVDFWAPWCAPCRTISPILEEISDEREDVRFVKLNVDDNPQAAMSYKVTSIPTIARFENGEITHQAVGMLPRKQLVEQLGL